MDHPHILKPTEKPKYQNAYLVQSSDAAKETAVPKKAKRVKPPQEVIDAREAKAPKLP